MSNYTKLWELLKTARDEADFEELHRISEGIELLLEVIHHRTAGREFTVRQGSGLQMIVTGATTDIQYQHETEPGFNHSFKKYTGKLPEPEQSIGVNKYGTWFVKVGEDVLSVEIKAHELTPLRYHGFWDHEWAVEDGEELSWVTIGKGKSANVDSIISEGLPAIPILEGFSPNDESLVWQKRLEDKFWQIKKHPPEKIPYIIIMDEPDGWSKAKLERITYLAKQAMPGYKFAMTFKEPDIRGDRLPENLDHIGINYYPIRVEGGEHTFKVFREKLSWLMQTASEKSGAEVFIVGQAFHGQKWSVPPLDLPDWYRIVLSENGVRDLYWFAYRDTDNLVCANQMPELVENIRAVA